MWKHYTNQREYLHTILNVFYSLSFLLRHYNQPPHSAVYLTGLHHQRSDIKLHMEIVGLIINFLNSSKKSSKKDSWYHSSLRRLSSSQSAWYQLPKMPSKLINILQFNLVMVKQLKSQNSIKETSHFSMASTILKYKALQLGFHSRKWNNNLI